MNVKLNLALSKMDSIEDIFIFPSCGDESAPIGAAYYEIGQNFSSPIEFNLKDLYWGPVYSDEEILDVLRHSAHSHKFSFERVDSIDQEVGHLLSKNKVVARCSGNMEFGARALGNRSILSSASSWNTVKIINQMIKQRDFWMPFAPTILDERADDYLENPKGIKSPYMIMAFDSRPRASQELIAAMHPYDMTLRPQILYSDWNNGYYSLISAFQSETGTGGILNTSFNLHGEPIVRGPEDAIHVLVNSGLQYLALGNYMVQKN